MACYWWICDSIILILCLLLLMCVDGELLMNDPYGSIYEDLNNSSLCLYVFTVILPLLCMNMGFYWVVITVSTALHECY